MDDMLTRYELPARWVRYEPLEILTELVEAKAAVMALTTMPFQRSWAEALQEMELKREIAGTSKIEGAEFTEREFEEAVSEKIPEGQLTRSQRQARAAMETYRWISKLSNDYPITDSLICEIHRRIVTGCDDDHCEPGALRRDGHNVSFGRPRHRGAEGGAECTEAFRRLCEALNQEFRAQDTLIQALAFHYHLGAIHPFQDGNGRTARAVEAMLLTKAGLKHTLFISMSNYYYDEKESYLNMLHSAGELHHDLTAFLKFGLRGIAAQCNRLLREIKRHVARSLFREVMAKMYRRLESTRKRALAKRQLSMLEKLLELDKDITVEDFFDSMQIDYGGLKSTSKAFARDINLLAGMGAVRVEREKLLPGRHPWSAFKVTARLDWPTEITETEFYQQINELPQAKTRVLVG
jgi:Fic family protein